MQRVVRSTLVGLLTAAGLAACGDKVTIPPVTTTPVGTVVHSVTVSPGSLTLNVGDKSTLAASVDADAGVTDRTVTWTSASTAIATVDANGQVTAVAPGNTSIIAASKADPTVKGAASVTVQGGGVVTVSISGLNTTVCTPTCATVTANKQDFGTGGTPPTTGQLDVTLNVDAGSQVLKNVRAVLTCGADSIVQLQTINGAAASVAAEASTAPVTLSFNTVGLNADNTPQLHNGNCTLKASATTASGTQSASNSETLVLHNADAVKVTQFTTTPSTGQIATAVDAAGFSWRAGAVNVTVVPIFYSAGLSAASATVSLVNDGADAEIGQAGAALAAGGVLATLPNLTPAAGVVTATFPNSTTAAGGVGGATVDTVVVTVTTIDSQGNPGPSITVPAIAALTSASFIRLDNQKPAAGTYALNTQNATNNWVGSTFAFTSAAGKGYTAAVAGDNGGVDKVAVKFQYTAAPSSGSSVWTDVTAASAIPNSPNKTNADYQLRMIETDALGNATTTTLSTFGADNNIPLAAFSGGTKDLATSQTNAAALSGGGSFIIAYSDSISGFNLNPMQTTLVRNFELTKTLADCVIGTWDATNKVCNVAGTTGTIAADGGSALNGYYTLTAFVIDQAGNASTPTLSRAVVIDNAAPTASGGVAIPATITGGSSVNFTSAFADNLDLLTADGSIVYPNMTLSSPGSLDTPGTAFDNVLTKSANATVNITNFISAMQQVDGANAPTAASALPTNVNIRASDEVGLFGTSSVALPPANIVNGTGAADFTTAQFATFAVSNAPKNIANGANPGNIATTVDLTAAIVGSTSLQNNPFTQVCFYYQQTAAGQSNTGEWVLIGCQSAASVTDDPVAPAATGRTWLYTFSAWNPPSGLGTAAAAQIRAIGQNSKGNGISTNTNTNITLVP